jgi:CO dehydrogenase nickel-insertion accessory protein CooC1
MEFQIAQRKRAKIKMAIQGHSGSGKTYSALLVAHGLSQSWEKVAVIDTENESSHLYQPLTTWTHS